MVGCHFLALELPIIGISSNEDVMVIYKVLIRE
jgi:hypothetical protein